MERGHFEYAHSGPGATFGDFKIQRLHDDRKVFNEARICEILPYLSYSVVIQSIELGERRYFAVTVLLA